MSSKITGNMECAFKKLIILAIVFLCILNLSSSNLIKIHEDISYETFEELKLAFKDSYSNLWQASQPDFVIYMPSGPREEDSSNQMVLVVPTPKKTFVAVWTQAKQENNSNQKVVVSRSMDFGKTWSIPYRIDGEENGNGYSAQYGVPIIVPSTGRLYVFYTKNIGIIDSYRQHTGELWFRYSDDDGLSWSNAYSIELRRVALDHPDNKIPPNWWFSSAPTILGNTVIVGMTRLESFYGYTSREVYKKNVNSECYFLRFDNILTESDPKKIKVSTLPAYDHGLQIRMPNDPNGSFCQEPTIVELSDGRYFSVMRTLQGKIYYSISKDKGMHFINPQPLLYHDHAPPILNPVAPAPIFKLNDGRFFLLFHNNDGSANGGKGPWDWRKNRTPAYFSIGHETLNNNQPISFSSPKILVKNDVVPAGPNKRTEIATYTSFFELEGHKYFWYPDRKHFLLGKIIDSFLAEK